MPRLSSAYQAVLRSLVDSHKINRVSWGAEALYVRLLLLADGAGRYFGEARVVWGKAAVGRPSSTAEEIEGFLQELEREGLIARFEGRLQIVNYFAPDPGRGKGRTVYFDPVPLSGTNVPEPGTNVPLIGDRRSVIGETENRSETRARAREEVSLEGKKTRSEEEGLAAARAALRAAEKAGDVVEAARWREIVTRRNGKP